MSITLSAKAVIKQIDNYIFDVTHNLDLTKSSEEQAIINEIEEKGFYVVENAFSSEWCKKVRNEIDTLLVENQDKIWIDGEKSDHRIYGANALSKKINEFYLNDFSNRILQSYGSTRYKEGFTLAAKLVAVESNKGSGGGWHRDSAFEKQTKAILYLSDVSDENGPFQFIKGSHNLSKIYEHQFKYNIGIGQNRISDDTINRMVIDNRYKLKTFHANAGTMILVNTRGIHRGKPIESGVRYALTNYNWLRKGIPPHMKRLLIN